MSLSSHVKYFSLTFFNSRCSYNSKIPVCDQIRAGCTICNLICSRLFVFVFKTAFECVWLEKTLN